MISFKKFIVIKIDELFKDLFSIETQFDRHFPIRIRLTDYDEQDLSVLRDVAVQAKNTPQGETARIILALHTIKKDLGKAPKSLGYVHKIHYLFEIYKAIAWDTANLEKTEVKDRTPIVNMHSEYPGIFTHVLFTTQQLILGYWIFLIRNQKGLSLEQANKIVNDYKKRHPINEKHYDQFLHLKALQEYEVDRNLIEHNQKVLKIIEKSLKLSASSNLKGINEYGFWKAVRDQVSQVEFNEPLVLKELVEASGWKYIGMTLLSEKPKGFINQYKGTMFNQAVDKVVKAHKKLSENASQVLMREYVR